MTAIILVADDDPFGLRLLSEVCETGGYGVVSCHDGMSALESMARMRPDVVLLDVTMPNMSGLEVLRVLKDDPDLARIPVVAIADQQDTTSREEAIAAGAFDFITRPYHVVEVHQRIRNALRLVRAEMRATIPPELGIVDPLTRAGTRPQMLVTLEYEFSRAARYKNPLSCIVVDVANLPELAAGGTNLVDGTMMELATGLRKCVRSVDHLFREAPGTFTLLLPETDATGTRTVFQRVAELAKGGFLSIAASPAPQMRAGHASYPAKNITTASELFRRAQGKLTTFATSNA